jgi:hypothetical protein
VLFIITQLLQCSVTPFPLVRNILLIEHPQSLLSLKVLQISLKYITEGLTAVSSILVIKSVDSRMEHEF